MKSSSWTQPCCDGCWRALCWGRGLADVADENPAVAYAQMVARVVRSKEPLHETCVFCGHGTTSGIYIRVDPALTDDKHFGFTPTNEDS